MTNISNSFEYVIRHKEPDDGYLYVSREIFLQLMKDKDPELYLEVFYTSCRDCQSGNYERDRSYYDGDHFYMFDSSNYEDECPPYLIY